jgi:hypothetical protein
MPEATHIKQLQYRVEDPHILRKSLACHIGVDALGAPLMAARKESDWKALPKILTPPTPASLKFGP